jgi:hypothetical protein
MKNGSTMLDKVTKECTLLRKKSGIYVFDIWIPTNRPSRGAFGRNRWSPVKPWNENTDIRRSEPPWVADGNGR